MDILIFEKCWAVNSEIIKQVTSSWSIFTQLSVNTLHQLTALKFIEIYTPIYAWLFQVVCDFHSLQPEAYAFFVSPMRATCLLNLLILIDNSINDTGKQ